MSWARDLSIDDFLALKKAGHYRIEEVDGGHIVSIHRPGEPIERYLCTSPGIANQLRIHLSDMGLTGFIEGAR